LEYKTTSSNRGQESTDHEDSLATWRDLSEKTGYKLITRYVMSMGIKTDRQDNKTKQRKNNKH